MNYDPDNPPNYFDTRHYRAFVKEVHQVIKTRTDGATIREIKFALFDGKPDTERRNIETYLIDAITDLEGAELVQNVGSALITRLVASTPSAKTIDKARQWNNRKITIPPKTKTWLDLGVRK